MGEDLLRNMEQDGVISKNPFSSNISEMSFAKELSNHNMQQSSGDNSDPSTKDVFDERADKPNFGRI